MRSNLRLIRFAQAFSLSNLVLIGEREELFAVARRSYYINDISSVSWTSALLFVVVLAGIFFVALSFAERAKRPYVRKAIFFTFFLMLLVTVQKIRSAAIGASERPELSLSHFLGIWGPYNVWLKVALLGPLASYVALRYFAITVSIFRYGLLLLLPLSLGTWAKITWQMAVSEARPPRLLASTPGSSARLIWIIFDELDGQFVFEQRPKTLLLPEFDRFRSESLYASHASSPSGATLKAIPSLLLGDTVTEAVPKDGSDLEIQSVHRTGPVSWKAQSSIFSDARAQGIRTGIAGWFHPYCRVLASDLDECNSYAISQWPFPNRSLAGFTEIFSRWLRWRDSGAEVHRRIYYHVLEDAKALVENPTIGLAVLHFPVPHHPSVLSAKERIFTYPSDPMAEDYFNNVIVADQALGEIRSRLEARNLWDKTHVLVTSDHPWRFASKKFISTHAPNGRNLYVPFLLKMAGESSGMSDAEEFSTVVLRELSNQLLRGNLKDQASVRAWLDRQSETR